jgi:membrane-associated phospholipid phosphatase
MGFAVYLFFTKRRQFLLFLFTFVLVNFLGFIVYYTFPAAPPWYIQYHGFTFHKLTPGNTAGLAKFDAYFNVSIFKSIYAKGSNVFAAMPSLHSSYPIIVLYYGLKNKLGKANIFFGAVMIGIWFSAVYLSHHYIVDVLAGILCAIIGISLFNFSVSKAAPFRRFIDNYEKLIK